MVDSSKVIIKINYQGRKRNLKGNYHQEVVNEWNVQRIITVAILLIIIILFSFVFISDDTFEQKSNAVNERKKDNKVVIKDNINFLKENELNNGIKQTNINDKTVESVIHAEKNTSEINTIPLVVIDKRIARAFVTSKLINKEPTDDINSAVIVSNNGAIRLYYFTEIIDMKGQFLYHHWLLDDRIIFTRKINISGNRWRASTSKLISYYNSGLWKVRVLNKESDILNEIQFKVIKE